MTLIQHLYKNNNILHIKYYSGHASTYYFFDTFRLLTVNMSTENIYHK